MELYLRGPSCWERWCWGCRGGARRVEKSRRVRGSPHSPRLPRAPPFVLRRHRARTRVPGRRPPQEGFRPEGMGLMICPRGPFHQHTLQPRFGSDRCPGATTEANRRKAASEGPTHLPSRLDKGYELLRLAWSRACVRRRGQVWRASQSPRTTIPRSLWELPNSVSRQVGAHVAQLGDAI